MWAQTAETQAGVLTANPEIYKALKAPPPNANSVEWPIEQNRAAEAAARAFWPLGASRLERRLPLIKAPTLIVWGKDDKLYPPSYADRFTRLLETVTRIVPIAGAGHLAELDQPDLVAEAILDWTS